MKAIEITKILNTLKDMQKDTRRKELNQYSVETLEEFAVYIWSSRAIRKESFFDLLDDMLNERVYKLQKSFTWTPENKDRLLIVNDKITKIFEKAYDEAIAIAQKLEEEIITGSGFAKDYEIKIEITPYTCSSTEANDDCDIGIVLSGPLDEYYPISYSFEHDDFYLCKYKKPIFLDTSLNWNIKYFNRAFDDHYIGYGIHALLDTSMWSFQDIINIKQIWADVKVTHQNFEEF